NREASRFLAQRADYHTAAMRATSSGKDRRVVNLPIRRDPQLPSPAKVAIGIVPFLRHIEVEPLQPALLGPGGRHGPTNPVRDSGTLGQPGVRRDARDTARGGAEGPLLVRRLFRVELPGDELAKDDVAGFALRQDAIASHRGSAGYKGQLTRITIVHVRRPD